MNRGELKNLIKLAWEQYIYYKRTHQLHKADEMKHKIRLLKQRKGAIQ